MKLAAIDIGSNAARLQISNVLKNGDEVVFKKIQYIRYPLRLGEDVFSFNKISDSKAQNFLKLIQSFKILMDLYGVNEYYACATSAMREAQNGQEIADNILQETGIKINIISGSKEAEMINRVIAYHLSDEHDCLHIDVGGGSTELNLYRKKSIIASKSFPIGSVRLLKQLDNKASWEEMKVWIKEYLTKSKNDILAIGTGGNIAKLFDLAKGIKGKHISISKLQEVSNTLKNLSLEDRINKLRLNPDRADVIIPASDIYIYTMKTAGANKILVPDVGLKDGILTYLYDNII